MKKVLSLLFLSSIFSLITVNAIPSSSKSGSESDSDEIGRNQRELSNQALPLPPNRIETPINSGHLLGNTRRPRLKSTRLFGKEKDFKKSINWLTSCKMGGVECFEPSKVEGSTSHNKFFDHQHQRQEASPVPDQHLSSLQRQESNLLSKQIVTARQSRAKREREKAIELSNQMKTLESQSNSFSFPSIIDFQGSNSNNHLLNQSPIHSPPSQHQVKLERQDLNHSLVSKPIIPGRKNKREDH